MLRRWGYFFLTNILILVTISFVTSLFGFNRYITGSGLNMTALLGFCLVWGMAGSFISLLLSRFMAKRMMGVEVIDPNNPGQFSWLVSSIHSLSKQAKLPAMPEVGVYQSPELNAFATGPSKSKSLVAVSTGLLSSMSRDEIEGVLAHEVAHIQNGDMVTMTLLQGIINATVMFLARIIAYGISVALSSRNNSNDESPAIGHGFLNGIIVFVLEIFLSILGSMVVCYFSRTREFKADAGSAALAGKDKMIAALKALQARFEPIDTEHKSLATMKIAGSGRWELFSTHPSLESRIQALQGAAGR